MSLVGFDYKKIYIMFIALMVVVLTSSCLQEQNSQTPKISDAEKIDQVYYVSLSGSDDNPGTLDQPFRRISQGLLHLAPGDTLMIGPGTFEEKLAIEVSGTKEKPIRIMGSLGQNGKETIISQGSEDLDGLINIDSQSYIKLESLILKGNQTGDTPMGIYVTGSGSGYTLSDLDISDIQSNQDAHGIAFYGSGEEALSDIIISDSSIHDCLLGSSEALVLNGNVTDFVIENNQIYNHNNIGIDCIGFEGTSSYHDQARNGIIRNNHVENISSLDNPAYGGQGAAGGIYVDGGKDILIQNNVIVNCDIGIEVASEHLGKVTSGVEVIHNLIAESGLYGIAVGGASFMNGKAVDNIFTGNFFLDNRVDLAIQEGHSNIFRQNTFYRLELQVEGDLDNQVFEENLFLDPDDFTGDYVDLLNPKVDD